MGDIADKLLMNELSKVDAVHRARQYVLSAPHGAQATFKMGNEVTEVFGPLRRSVGQRAHHPQDVLDPMLQLDKQNVLAIFGGLAGINIDAAAEPACDFALG